MDNPKIGDRVELIDPVKRPEGVIVEFEENTINNFTFVHGQKRQIFGTIVRGLYINNNSMEVVRIELDYYPGDEVVCLPFFLRLVSRKSEKKGSLDWFREVMGKEDHR